MRVLGVDPGSRSTGWGVVVRDHGRYRALASGAILTGGGEMGPRLWTIHRGLQEVIAAHGPDCVALEAIFAHKSSTSALVLGQARGIVLLAAAQAGLPVFEYNASTIKKSVTGSGRADKDQVGRMVRMLLGEAFDGPHDRADALAIAMTHLAHAGLHAAIEGAR